jgi:Arc/MetJ-type ribon-helix-helix transcriptional regulator
VTITLQPHQEQAIQAAVSSGSFRSVEEFIDAAIAHLPEIVPPATKARDQERAETGRSLTVAERRKLEGRKSLPELFADSPFKGLNIEFDESEHEKDFGRDVDL